MNAVVERKKESVVVSSDSTALMKIIEKAASDPSFDVSKLEHLLVVRERWEAAEAAKAYNAAFSAFKSEAVEIVKNKGVTDGPLKGKRYAELFSVVNAVTPALSRHGLGASWKITKDEKDWIEVTCTLKHVLGHAESVSMAGPPDTGGAKNAIQARASTVTYLERYTLKAVCGLAEQGDDSDGAGGAKLMDEETLAGHLKAIDTAVDEQALFKAYAAGWKPAEKMKDKAAMRLLTQHKDSRKAAIGVKA